jgi:hypothetical protein
VKQFSYVIVAHAPGAHARARRHAGHGRHRLGTPGTALRYPAGPPRRPGRRRARHYRRVQRPSMFAVRYATLLVLLAAIGVSGWFAATGASAVAQMIQP